MSLDVRITSHTVEVFAGTERVASHPRFKAVRGRYSTVTAHMPEAHRGRLGDWTPQRFEQWAATVGPNTVAAITAILASRAVVEQSFRSCLGVMSLAKNPAASPDWKTPAPGVGGDTGAVHTLIKKLWAGWKPADPPPPKSLRDAGFVRGAGYYITDGAGHDRRRNPHPRTLDIAPLIGGRSAVGFGAVAQGELGARVMVWVSLRAWQSSAIAAV